MGFQKHEDIHSECESWTHVKRQIKLDLKMLEQIGSVGRQI